MKVGFTGTQKGMTTKQISSVTLFLDSTEVEELHHGDCQGADAQAHSIAFRLEIPLVLHPPENSSKRAYCLGSKEIKSPLGYLERNRKIVDETDVLLATPKGMKEELRSGTWSTIRYAIKSGKTVWIVFPDGSFKSNAPQDEDEESK